MDKKQELLEVINALDEKHIEVLHNIVTGKYNDKKALLSIAYNEEQLREVDSAYPQPYADAIRNVFPNWNGHFHAYDYNEKRLHGEMINVAEKFVVALNLLFN